MTAFGQYADVPHDGARERLFTIGHGRDLLLLPALFAEANRTRAFCVTVARLLARAGLRIFSPDLPGTLESTVPLERVAWADWQETVRRLIGGLHEPLVVTVRGGALLRTGDAPRLQFAPVSGTKLLRDLARAEAASLREAGRSIGTTKLLAAAAEARVDWAGFVMMPALTQPLTHAQPNADCWSVRLNSDPAAADERIDGSPLWRRAEPANDRIMADALARAVTDWSARCDAG